jgi:TRAP-type C4-dicarboxylate transport system substrate-binding protein
MSFIRSITGALALGAIASTAMAEEVTLRVANWLPPAHHMQKTIADWTAAVTEATGGEVKFDIMTTPLAPPPGQYDLVKNGVVDVAYSFAATTPTKFKKLRAIEMPFMVSSSAKGSAAVHDWYTSHGLDDEEFEGTHLLAAFVTPPFLIHSREPITTLADLEGKKIRAGGIGIEIWKKLGAAPVFLSPGDTTEALQRGTIDATQFTWESLVGFRMMDLSKNHLVVPDGGLYGTVFWIAINEKSWKKLSDAQRAAIEGMGVAGAKLIGEHWDAAEAASMAKAKENGNTVVTLDAENTAALKKAVSFVEADWIAAAGDQGQALMDDLRATLDKH